MILADFLGISGEYWKAALEITLLTIAIYFIWRLFPGHARLERARGLGHSVSWSSRSLRSCSDCR